MRIWIPINDYNQGLWPRLPKYSKESNAVLVAGSGLACAVILKDGERKVKIVEWSVILFKAPNEDEIEEK